LNSNHVDYLIVGGYAVCYHGYYRNTGDIDLWIAINSENALRMVRVLKEFGFENSEISPELFMQKGQMVRMGVEPTRIEVLTEISGCDFADAYTRAISDLMDGIPVKIIGLKDLVHNKLKSGRLKDLDDASKLS
jgi:predicted nucleotidyltransferase